MKRIARAAMVAWGMVAMAGVAQAGPGDPMITLLSKRTIPERAVIVELRDPDGVAVWPVPGEILFDKGPPKKITLGRDGLYFPIAIRRPVAIRLYGGRFGAARVSYPIDGDGGVRITLRYVPVD